MVRLVGEANDYVGKSMAGGDVTIVPPPGIHSAIFYRSCQLD